MRPRLRCAIYTRKSTEEGLDQTFNSLHAQREACEAYVLSQAGEGWSALRTTYDDGGYSGGSMDRPALRQLLDDIGRGLVDVVVVYKVDRLTRSLADFAKIVEQFDAKGVSFVSITQAFNTTTSMGRLTLNVLLSFAQFEREVTGERIRDKIAASKAKGLRMGGVPPLGYDVKDLRLIVNEAEAEIVRKIFRCYLEADSIPGLVAELEAQGVRSKRWVTKRGRISGDGVIGKGALYHLLSNPVFRGVNRHKDKFYEGAHLAIVDEQLWAAVQAKLTSGNASRPPATPKIGEGGLLDGVLRDDRGGEMVTTHTVRGPRRYRYYISRAKLTGKGEAASLPRISAGMLDAFVLDRIAPALSPSWAIGQDDRARVRAAIVQAWVGADQVVLNLHRSSLGTGSSLQRLEEGDAAVRVRLPLFLTRGHGALVLEGEGSGVSMAPKLDRALIRALVLARRWAAQLASGEVGTVKDLAHRNGLCPHYTMRLMPLAWLAPDIAAAILEGRQPRSLNLAGLTSKPLPLAWEFQRQLIGPFAG